MSRKKRPYSGVNTGIWQGVYLCGHRDHGGARRLIVTIHGAHKGE